MSKIAREKWSIDLNLNESDEGYQTLQKLPCALGMRRVAAMERRFQPVSGGNAKASFSTTDATVKSNVAQQQQLIVSKKHAKAMAIAMGPAKQILMNAFMLYMVGNNLNIFSISTTSMAIMNPLKSILTIGSMFAPLEDPDGKVDLQTPKLIFFVFNMIWLGIGLYKMSSMRLLPTTSADWSGRIVWKEMMEISSIPPV